MGLRNNSKQVVRHNSSALPFPAKGGTTSLPDPSMRQRKRSQLESRETRRAVTALIFSGGRAG